MFVVPEDCVNCTGVDLTETKERIGMPNFLMIVNQERIDFNFYEEKAIVRESVVFNQ
jgi:hypothetical protein